MKRIIYGPLLYFEGFKLFCHQKMMKDEQQFLCSSLNTLKIQRYSDSVVQSKSASSHI